MRCFNSKSRDFSRESRDSAGFAGAGIWKPAFENLHEWNPWPESQLLFTEKRLIFEFPSQLTFNNFLVEHHARFTNFTTEKHKSDNITEIEESHIVEDLGIYIDDTLGQIFPEKAVKNNGKTKFVLTRIGNSILDLMTAELKHTSILEDLEVCREHYIGWYVYKKAVEKQEIHWYNAGIIKPKVWFSGIKINKWSRKFDQLHEKLKDFENNSSVNKL